MDENRTSIELLGSYSPQFYAAVTQLFCGAVEKSKPLSMRAILGDPCLNALEHAPLLPVDFFCTHCRQ